MSMLAADVAELKQRLEEIVNFEDAKFCLDTLIPLEVRQYWARDLRKRRFYESHPLWEKYDYEYECEDVPQSAALYVNDSLEIDGEKLSILDMGEINLKLVPRGYLYYCSSGFGGKLKLLLGEIEAHRRVQEADVYLVGRELVCNCEMNSPALYNHAEKTIVGRKVSAEFSVWRRIEELKAAKGVNRQLVELELLNLTELGLEDFWREHGSLAGVKKAAEHKLGAWVAHELGHFGAKKYFSHTAYSTLKQLCFSRGDFALDAFVTAVNDVLADTIWEDEIKGTIAFIIQEPRQQKLGLLSSHVLDIINPPIRYRVLVEKQKLEGELVSTFLDWLKDADADAEQDADLAEKLEKARRAVFERARQFIYRIQRNLFF